MFQHKSETDRKAHQLHFAIRIGNIDYIKTMLADGVDLSEVNSVSTYISCVMIEPLNQSELMHVAIMIIGVLYFIISLCVLVLN